MNTTTTTRQATQSPRRVDFELAAYMKSDDRIALWQIISTVLPIVAISIGLGVATQSLSAQTLAISAALFALLVLFLSRSFSLMHDCGHQSLFRSKNANRVAAFLLSLIHGMPHHPWSRGHAFHHKHNGNWDRYRGPSALITSQEFDQKQTHQSAYTRFSVIHCCCFPVGFST